MNELDGPDMVYRFLLATYEPPDGLHLRVGWRSV